MSLHKMLHQLCLLVVIFAGIAAEVRAAKAKPGCPEREICGNVTIPYPFSTREDCYLDDSFLITCNDSVPFLGNGNIDVLNISLDGQMVVSSVVSYDCYNSSGGLDDFSETWLTLSKFSVSDTRNKFTVLGCDTYAYVQGYEGKTYKTGCMSLCDNVTDVLNGSCSGIGCCQTSIPKGATDFEMRVRSFDNHKGIWDFNPCGFAFVVQEGKYNFSSIHLRNVTNSIETFPVAIDWGIGNKTCEAAKKDLNTYACGKNSTCYDYNNAAGYFCNCSEGYQGNPYLPYVCEDIDECENPTLNRCTHICNNIDGNYTCSCPEGYRGDGDGRKYGYGCVKQSLWIKVSLGISIGLTVILVIIAFIYAEMGKRKISKVREDFFRKNGGEVLEELLSGSVNSVETAKIFKEEELKKATNNFNERLVLGEGGFGIVYKGTLADNRIIAIKKSKSVDPGQIKQFVTEVKILSQINHPNVVKLFGVCLETPVPLLVYEFITNNTLFHHLHDEGRASSMRWELRLKIATETADALAHMHSTTQIIHRDIKSANILLNDDYTAKVSDFGISKLVPSGSTHLTTLVQGTYGYIDPEYFDSGNLTEKSDVYSFGVILAELLTGEQVVSSARPEKNRSLAKYFTSSVEEDHLFQILDDRAKSQGNPEQLKRVAELAKKCLKMKGEKRPTMEEVKKELEALREIEGRSLVEILTNVEEREPLLSEPVAYHHNTASSGLDSMRNFAVFQVDNGGR